MASAYRTYFQHPKFEEIVKRFPGNEEQIKLAFQVYIDLIEARGWWDVDVHHSERLQLMFVSGRARGRDPNTLFVPVDVTEEVSPEQIHSFCEHLALPGHTTHGITLAICDKDSSTTYFKVSNSLIAPSPPEVTDVHKRTRANLAQSRRDHLNSEIRRFCEERTVPGLPGTQPCGADSGTKSENDA
ncbi:tRNA-splicing endonuclease subunit Sen15-like isoform X2 [Gigantopelta aegis]|uniref:tRNA-splicing endonuclease subunit Sen15-like isoform X2 n=1 Tax=Gigantopelta aegis TaxID=1735272 RepID=UPI001B88BE1F|nr:tRNA-splicing endonuclease subunit Sen15-like isoform X2 [Gigantopelta aegis]